MTVLGFQRELGSSHHRVKQLRDLARTWLRHMPTLTGTAEDRPQGIPALSSYVANPADQAEGTGT